MRGNKMSIPETIDYLKNTEGAFSGKQFNYPVWAYTPPEVTKNNMFGGLAGAVQQFSEAVKAERDQRFYLLNFSERGVDIFPAERNFMLLREPKHFFSWNSAEITINVDKRTYGINIESQKGNFAVNINAKVKNYKEQKAMLQNILNLPKLKFLK